jgi:flagellar protein FliJ
MKRAQRLTMVQRAVEDLERRRAEKLALSERRVKECETRLIELETYQGNYCREFAKRASRGIGAVGLRDYQTFLARLAEAVRQQSHVVFMSRAERDAERRSWQNAAQRAEAVGRIVKRWQNEDRRTLERHEQHESDERAQRISPIGLHARGA